MQSVATSQDDPSLVFPGVVFLSFLCSNEMQEPEHQGKTRRLQARSAHEFLSLLPPLTLFLSSSVWEGKEDREETHVSESEGKRRRKTEKKEPLVADKEDKDQRRLLSFPYAFSVLFPKDRWSSCDDVPVCLSVIIFGHVYLISCDVSLRRRWQRKRPRGLTVCTCLSFLSSSSFTTSSSRLFRWRTCKKTVEERKERHTVTRSSFGER